MNPVKMLHIEDEQMDQEALRRFVAARHLPWDVQYVQSLEEARAILQSQRFDLVLVDYHLPDGTSVELFESMGDTPFIVVTGTLEEQLASRTVERGADDYLIKDVEHKYLEVLPRAVEKSLYRKALHERKKRLTEELHCSEERFRMLVEGVEDYAIFMIDEEGRVVTWNSGAEKLKGYKASEVLGHHLATFYTPEDQAAGRPAQVLAWAAEHGRYSEEGWRVRKDGSRFWALVTTSAIKDAKGNLCGFAKVVRDLTVRKEGEDALRASEKRLRFVAERAEVGYWDWDLPLNTLDCSPLCKQLLGIREEDGVAYEHFLTAVHPEDRDMVMDAVRSSVARPNVDYNVEFRVSQPEGKTRWLLSRGSAAFADGQAVRMAGIVMDITSRKQAELDLADHQQRLAGIIGSAMDAIISVDENQRIVLFNPAAERMFGCAANEALGSKIDRFIPARFWPSDGDGMNQFSAAGHTSPAVGSLGAISGVRVGGQEFPIEASISQAVIGGHKLLSVILRDVTERKRSEEALRALAEFPAENPEPVMRISPEGMVLHANRAAAELPNGWRCRQGEPAPEVLVRLVRQSLAARAAKEEDLEEPGGRVFAFSVAPMPDRGYANVYGREITERKLARKQLEQAKEAAEAANRAKDHFLAVLSHELRNPLTPVLPALAAMESMVPEEGAEFLEIARRNVELEARLIDDLLDVTRIARGKVELDRQVVNLVTVLHRAIEVCQADIEAREQHFSLNVDEGPHLVLADIARLQQVFWNLIKNAVKFTANGGCVGVRVWKEDERVRVAVTDSGVGITSEALARIFDAFEQETRSTTRQFGGLGLGLAISKALVEMHGGHIYAESAGRDRGATFTVELPVARPVEVERPAGSMAPARHEKRGGGLSILLVEDHGDTARIMGRLLKSQGHKVVHAGDVRTALAAARQGRFDVLVSDVGLPDGSGHELMRQLVATGRHVPGIALSGYGMAADVQKSREAGFAEHITKPVNLEALLGALHRVAGK